MMKKKNSAAAAPGMGRIVACTKEEDGKNGKYIKEAFECLIFLRVAIPILHIV